MLTILVILAVSPSLASGAYDEGGNFTGLVYNGTPAEIKHYPFVAYVDFQNGGAFCTGSIISSRTIVTAAHCLIDKNSQTESAKDFKVLVGTSKALDKKAVRHAVYKVIPHSGYNNQGLNDIGLLILEKPLKFSSTVKSIDRATIMGLAVGNPVRLIAFGAAKKDGPSVNLRYADLEIQHDEKCLDHYGSDTFQSKSVICAGIKGKQQCSGDSGGPLTYLKNKKRFLYGTVSFGPKSSCSLDVPATYSKVPYFNSWIDAHGAQ